jgi:PAS domain S-box-containing protein
MRDDHRPKQELVHEITGLRKQVMDLREAMAARRRIEDALRATEELLRALTDSAPVGLCLFRKDGTLVTANRPFARMLGYDSPAELQAVGGVLGVFASPEEQSRALGSSLGAGPVTEALFRLKDGCRRKHSVLRAYSEGGHALTLAVFDCSPVRSHPSFPATSA